MAKKIQIDLQVKDKGSKDVKKFAKTTDKSFDSIARSAKSMNTKLKRSFTGIQNGMKKVSKSILSMRTALVATAAAAGMGYFIKQSLDMADAIAKTADSLGMGTEALQEFQFAAKIAGVESSQLDMGLRFMVKAIGDASNGFGTLTTALKDNNDELLEQLINAESVEDQFKLSMRAIDDTTDATDKATLSMTLFGSRSGLALVNLAGGLEKSLALAKKYGIAIEDSFLRKSEEANDALTLLSAVIKKNLTEAVLTLAPYITEIANKMSEWIRQNKDLIKIKVPAFIKAVGEAIKTMLAFVSKVGFTGVGAIAGALFGPYGIIAGGLIGAAIDLVSSKLKNLYGILKLSGAHEELKLLLDEFDGYGSLVGAVMAKSEVAVLKFQAAFAKSRKVTEESFKKLVKYYDEEIAKLTKVYELTKKLIELEKDMVREALESGDKAGVESAMTQTNKLKSDLEELVKIIWALNQDKKNFLSDWAPRVIEVKPLTPEDAFAQRIKEIRATVELNEAIKNLNKTELDAAAKRIESAEVWNGVLAIRRELLDEEVASIAEDLAKVAELENKALAFEMHINEIMLENARAAAEAQEALIDQFAAYPMADMFTDWITGAKTFKEAFSDMAASIGRDLIRMAIKAMILKAVTAGMGGLFGSGGGTVTTIQGGEGGGYGFAEGGIATGPKSGYPVTLHGTEAIIPLGSGKKSGLGGSVTNNVTMNVTAAPGVSDEDAAKQGRQMARAFESEIDKRMVYQMRPGGLLYAGGR